MSEFRERQDINKIIDFNDNNNLKIIKERPFSIVLCDMIDQAHPSIISFLLNALESGKIICKDDSECDISKCIFIFTTNKIISGLGFSSNTNYSVPLKKLIDSVQNICYFETIKKNSIIKYITNYCINNNICSGDSKLLINSVINNYDYKNKGFSKIKEYIDNYLKNKCV